MMPDEELEQKELRRLLRAIFEEMPHGQKVVFIGVYLDGKTPREMAKECDITPGGIYARIIRGMRDLRRRGRKRMLRPYFEKRP